MGKNSIIKSLGKCIGNVVLHKIVLKHTNIPESKKHLEDEIRDYGSDVLEKAQEFTWTEEEKSEIEDKALRRVKNIIRNYPDLDYEEPEIKAILLETIKEMLE